MSSCKIGGTVQFNHIDGKLVPFQEEQYKVTINNNGKEEKVGTIVTYNYAPTDTSFTKPTKQSINYSQETKRNKLGYSKKRTQEQEDGKVIYFYEKVWKELDEDTGETRQHIIDIKSEIIDGETIHIRNLDTRDSVQEQEVEQEQKQDIDAKLDKELEEREKVSKEKQEREEKEIREASDALVRNLFTNIFKLRTLIEKIGKNTKGRKKMIRDFNNLVEWITRSGYNLQELINKVDLSGLKYVEGGSVEFTELVYQEIENLKFSGDNITHKVGLHLAGFINVMEQNMNLMAKNVKSLPAIKRELKTIKNNMKANGYEIRDLLGETINLGHNVVVEEVRDVDETLREDQMRVIKVWKPQVNYNDKMIQAGEVTVICGEDTIETKEDIKNCE